MDKIIKQILKPTVLLTIIYAGYVIFHIWSEKFSDKILIKATITYAVILIIILIIEAPLNKLKESSNKKKK